MKKRRRDLTVMQQLARGPIDIPFLMLVVILTVIGVIMVFSASYPTAMNEGLSPTNYFFKQATFGGVGLVAMYLISKINYQTFRGLSVFVLAISIILLVLVIPFGYGRSTVGAQRWISLPIIGGFQPSEIAKVGVIMYFAARLSKRNTEKHKRLPPRHPLSGLYAWLDEKGVLEPIPYFVVLGLVAILMLMEPHMSGTILVLMGGASVLFAAGIRLYWFIGGGTAAAAGLFFIMTQTSYMATRLAIWKDPWNDGMNGRGSGFQTIQSLYAIGSGGLLGVGLGKSRQKFLYLPESENDYIFSIVCEELGFIGAAIIILLFVLLIIRGYWIAVHARDRFGALLVVGITTLTAVQVFLNIAVVTNLIPSTGISLPFFSYGGTALMIQLGEMGMVLSVSRQIPAPKQE
ncbi:FtsW/RodA/SpoVE family cell cycle protein [Flavonifractor sp. An82]|uniref:FtsW/RodA/SpoVE family cell cycle protein n=1 Tax=Flavonifractor sp. An82 TaxID=1965660 RepID=UPI001FA88034|nr:putative peptidoglycan glycosyltransferase FtsW [Flavonifractor sp. An82]